MNKFLTMNEKKLQLYFFFTGNNLCQKSVNMNLALERVDVGYLIVFNMVWLMLVWILNITPTDSIFREIEYLKFQVIGYQRR